MDLKPGFKRTEIGNIPVDWEVIRLTDVVTKVASGRTRNHSEFGEFPVWGSTGLIGKSSHGDYAGKAILVARVGANAGKLRVVQGQYGVTDNTIIVKPLDQISIEYLWRQLYARNLNSMVFGSGQPLITGAQIKNLEIPWPERREQEAIADALSDADALIESLERLIDKKRRIKEGAMQELLTGRTRLPGFEVQPGYKSTEVGSIPVDWKVQLLNNLFIFQNGLNAEKSAYGKGLPFINVMEIIRHVTILPLSIPGKISVDDSLIKAYEVSHGDIVFNRTSETQEEIGLASVYLGFQPVVFGGFVIRAQPVHNGIQSTFMSLLLRSSGIRTQITSKGQGAVRANIGQRDLALVHVPLPSIAEQQAIADVFTQMDDEITALEGKLEKARQIKQGMMQELLTGRIRLR